MRCSRTRLLAAFLAVGAAALVGAVAAYASFVNSTSNSANSFAAGTVALSDNDSGVAMLALSSAKPLDTDSSCIKVRFDGTLASRVVLYGTVSGTIAQYVTLTVTRGTDTNPVFDTCTTFSADGTNYIGSGNGVIYSGALSGFPTTYAMGIVDPTAGSPATWNSGDSHIYKFTVTLADDPNDQGLSGTTGFTWEARNQ